MIPGNQIDYSFGAVIAMSFLSFALFETMGRYNHLTFIWTLYF